MKLLFFVDQKPLAAILALVQNICNKKVALEATANVFFQISDAQEVIIRATDLDISLQFSLPAKVVVATEVSSFLVNAKRLYDFVKELTSLVKFSYDGTTLSINYGNDEEALDPNFHLSLLTTDPATFPVFPERIENVTSLDANFLQYALEKTSPLIPSSNPNPALNCLLLDFDTTGLDIVSTDGHSLACVRNPNYSLSQAHSWMLPKKSVLEFKKIIDSFLQAQFSSSAATAEPQELFLGLCKGQVVFSGPNFNFFSRLIADPFPNYKALLNFTDFHKGQLMLPVLTTILRRVGYLLAGRFLPASLAFDQGRLQISLSNPDSGEFSEAMSFVASKHFTFTLKFYTPYLLAACAALGQQEADFFIKSATQPLVFIQEKQEITFTYLVMPMAPENLS